MQKLKSIISVLCLVLIIACSQDQNVSVEDQTKVDFTITKAQGTDQLLVEYHDGVKEDRKQEIRDHYEEIKFLITWEFCDHPDKETWTVTCGKLACRESDVPVETDDDDVKKRTLNIPCPEE